ncbi:MAG TPA: ion channel [Candidatus Bathyarchaeia archaeon]|nr:ion channel [Candidatus Bathyarchaeia archaeon]
MASLIYYPYVREGSFSYDIFRVVSGAGILLAVYAVKVRRALLACAILLAIPAVLQKSLLFRADAGLFSLLGTLLSFAFDVFIVVLIFRRVFAEHQVKSETIFGAICIYLLIGYSFAGIYAMMDTLQPRAFYFDPILNPHTVPNRFDFIYYSFATMTSMGPAGISPVTRQARSFTVIETTLGVLYLAVLIARLMAAYRVDSLGQQD